MAVVVDQRIVRNLLLAIGEQDLKIRKEKASLTETWFHKLLFDLKQKVDNKEIRDALQFYWYKHGPFSETVKQELVSLYNENIFSQTVSENGFVFYRLEKRISLPNEGHFSVAKKVLNQIIIETDLFKLNNKVKEIYDNAPYKFMKNYKHDYLERIREFKYFIETGEENEKFLENYKEKLTDSLYGCESLLPFDKTFSEFNQVFANMVGEITTFMSMNNGKDLFLLDESLRVSEEAWECFAKGLRLEHHDSFYDKKVPFWKKDFSDSVKRFTKTVALLNEELLEKYSEISLKEIEPQTDTNTIMKAIVLGYTNE
ncbi:MAG: hypothetical protein ABIH20_02755 [Candidatus Diapherotrites archaeon]